MKIAIIGAGNMGRAIALGLYESGLCRAEDLFVADVNEDNLKSIKKIDDKIFTTSDNREAVRTADYVLLAVKPWFIEPVITLLKPALNTVQHVVISIAAGVSLNAIADTVGYDFTLFRILPNTAISIRESMTFISSLNASKEQEENVSTLFGKLGKVLLIPESEMGAFTSVSSCGIAYALRYLRAATQGAVELGIQPGVAQEVIAQTMIGAAQLILQNKSNPEVEIDKVTTPGGWTIKGLNTMEEYGFSNAVIKGIKANGYK
ncbi:MAG: pyrroline-5-carboxylate reductase [Prevotellaceae bacterium]|jgi:pyrroline-5-carboxylate reductase|nr:pyrroline-5-carboxylate reductase [Prevotellaceae bacterium]